MAPSSTPAGSLVNVVPLQALESLAEVSAVPFLKPAVSLVTFLYERAENVKVYRQSCHELSGRCVELLLSLNGNIVGMEGYTLQQTADEVEFVIEKVRKRMERWAGYSLYQSIFRQAAIKEGIDASYREIDHCMRKLSLSAHVDQSHSHATIVAIQSRDNAELRDMLQRLSSDIAELKSTATQNIHEVPAIMRRLQEELRNTSLPPAQERDFRTVLRELRNETALILPLADLTGQITNISSHAVAFGGSSDIHTGVWLDEEKVALKRHRAFNSSAGAKQKFVREIEIWRPLQHANILPFYGTVLIGSFLSMVSPWMEHGNIREYLKGDPDVPRLPMIWQIADGMDYLHSKNVVHGDIRGNNILVDISGTPYIADFGLSKLHEELEDGSQSTFVPGSLRWTSPELIKPELIGREAALLSMETDSWSFGMLCLELLTGSPPFFGMRNDFSVAQALVDGRLPTRPPTTPAVTDDIWRFMMTCWQADPAARPSMRETSEVFRRLARKPRAASFEAPIRNRGLSHVSVGWSPGRHLASLPEVGFSNELPPVSPRGYSRALNLSTSSSGSTWGVLPASGHARQRSETGATLYTPERSPRPLMGTPAQRYSYRSSDQDLAALNIVHNGPEPRNDERSTSQDFQFKFLPLPPPAIQDVVVGEFDPNALKESPQWDPSGLPPILPPSRPPVGAVERTSPGGSETSSPARTSFLKKFSFSSSPRLPSAEVRLVFGQPLEEVVTYAGLEVPVVLKGREPMYQIIPICVSKCGFWLKTYALNEIGIFRKEGSQTRMRKLQAIFETPPGYGKHLDMKQDFSIADTAGVLRKYVTELPAPLIPTELYPRFVRMLDPKDELQSLAICDQLIEDMPRPNCDLFLYLIDLLSTFAKHSNNTAWHPSGQDHPSNMTPISDLVELFQPALLRNPSQDWWQGESQRCCKVLVFITERVESLLRTRSKPLSTVNVLG